MKNLFVTYEIALALKEKEFNEPCMGAYFVDKTFHGHNSEFIRIATGKEKVVYNEFLTMGSVSAPLYAQVVDWFREEHSIVLGCDVYSEGDFSFKIWQKGINPQTPKKYRHYSMTDYYDTYYQALEYAIIEAIKLI